MVSGSLSLPLLGFFSPFPHGTPSLSVTDSVFSLRSWSTLLQTGFLVPCLTQVPHHRVRFVSLTGLSPSSVVLSGTFCYPSPFFSTGYPHAALLPHFSWFGLLQFRSPLLSESLLISFPGLLRWFTSPSFAPPPYFIQVLRCMNLFIRITPFGYPRLSEYVLLPVAFRSLSRPSSPVSS